MSVKHSVWEEKYRPRSTSDVIFRDSRQQNEFKKFVDDQDIPSILLYGIQGTGKTTISRALIRDLNIDSADVLKINCSDKKIEALRNEVTSFAMTSPLGKIKVVRLEEFDRLSPDAQGLLRALIEDTSATCRFIATCNYINLVSPPLRSRFQEFFFQAPDKDKIAERMVDILDKENVSYEPEDLLAYIDIGYPDIRKTISLLSQNSVKGKLLPYTSTASMASDWKFGLLDCIIKGDFKTARKLVCESSTREEHVDVFTFLYQNVDKMKVSDPDSAIILIAEHLNSHSMVADTEINLASLFIQLGKL